MSRAYYNEFDPFAAAWLRELITEGLVAPGDVDTRSIKDVRADDLKGYIQHHFFAGIGGWSYALRLGRWADDRPVWTGSCPCQPFSVAGRGLGTADERHLWPEFRRLISECNPPVVFGEQVASKDGRLWLAGVRSDLEALGYACGAADLCAAGLGAPHIRQRLYWVADADQGQCGWEPNSQECLSDGTEAGRLEGHSQSQSSSTPSGVANSQCNSSDTRRLANESGECPTTQGRGPRPELGRRGMARGLGNTIEPRLEGHSGHGNYWNEPRWLDSHTLGPTATTSHPCADGKTRRISLEPALFPLADGIPNRVGTLRGAGNAIVPQVAAEFIQSYLETLV